MKTVKPRKTGRQHNDHTPQSNPSKGAPPQRPANGEPALDWWRQVERHPQTHGVGSLD